MRWWIAIVLLLAVPAAGGEYRQNAEQGSTVYGYGAGALRITYENVDFASMYAQAVQMRRARVMPPAAVTPQFQWQSGQNPGMIGHRTADFSNP